MFMVESSPLFQPEDGGNYISLKHELLPTYTHILFLKTVIFIVTIVQLQI
jgi:hypothetical protein